MTNLNKAQLDKMFEKALSELEEFFEFEWNDSKPNLILVKDRKAIDQLLKKKTENWLVGWINNGNIYALCPENYESESCHKFSKEEYSALIKHELSHLFTNHFCDSKSGLNPRWIWEGLSLYLAGQNKTKVKPSNFKNFLDYYSKRDSGVYKESGFAVEYLIKTYGKKKFFKLIKLLPKIKSKKEFTKLFENIYKFNLNYKNFK